METYIFPSKFLRQVPMLFALAMLASTPVSAQEDDGPNALQKVLGAAGILDLPKPPIDYQERAPLVVPPSAILPPPRSSDDVKRLNPEWPLDQDLQRARASAQGSKFPTQVQDRDWYDGKVLRPSELSRAKPQKSQSANTDGDTAGAEANRGAERYTPSQLGFKGWGKKNEEIVFKGEPDRTSLLEPPPGYLTPSPNAPYGVVEEKKASTSTTTSVFDRLNDPNAKK